MRPTRLGILVFLLGMVPAALPVALDPGWWTHWLAFLCLLLLIFSADAVFGPPLRRLNLSLSLPDPLFVGGESEGALHLANPSGPRMLVQIKLDVSPELLQVPAIEALLAARTETTVPVHLRPARRGQAVVEAAWLRARGPFGLVLLQRRVEMRVVRPVVPDLPAIQQAAGRLLTRRDLQVGFRVEKHRGDGTEFDHLREYMPGFDIRRVDWKASARHAKMLVREFRAERNRPVVLAIDSGRLMGEPIAGIPRLDYAIHAALVLATVSLHVGDQVGLASFDDRLRQFFPPLRGQAALGELSRAASQIVYSTSETNFTLGLLELMRQQTRRALVVVMTDFVDTITAELMIENLSWLARHHLVLFVALQDPLPLQVSGHHPRRLLDLHRAVVSHGLLQDRELVIRRLQRMGILCLDSRPERLSAGLIEHYLEAKRREMF